jgi:hypothetical protein
MWYLDIEDTAISCETTDEVIYYMMGYGDPHYPVPTTMEEADMATNHRWITGHCPEEDGPCLSCIGEFLDSIEFWYL